jgi:replicative DNA helicase
MKNKGIDRLPPHSTEAEMGVLGCCLIRPQETLAKAQIAIKTDDYFYDIKNRAIWQQINQMETAEISLPTVFYGLKEKENIIPPEYLAKCEEAGIGPSFLETWLDIVIQKRILRQAIKVAEGITLASYGGQDAFLLLDEAERAIMGIRPAREAYRNIKALLVEAIGKMEEKYQKGGGITGLSTGLKDLDRLSDGLHPGEMIVLAAYPSCGKSALSLNIAVHCALKGEPVAFFTAEMASVQLAIRMICSESRVNFHSFTEQDVQKMTVAVNRLSSAPIHIVPCSGMSIGQVKATARQLKLEHDIKLAVIDSVQLLSGTGDNREQQIASISRGIKQIAIDLNICAMGLSQLNDEGKLRESRALNQDADTVWKLKNKVDWQPDIQPITLEIEKCRDGSTGHVDLIFRKTFTRFENAEKLEADYD